MPIGVFVYKTTEINCRSQHFAEFIQTQIRYPTSCHIKSKLFLLTKFLEILRFARSIVAALKQKNLRLYISYCSNHDSYLIMRRTQQRSDAHFFPKITPTRRY